MDSNRRKVGHIHGQGSPSVDPYRVDVVHAVEHFVPSRRHDRHRSRARSGDGNTFVLGDGQGGRPFYTQRNACQRVAEKVFDSSVWDKDDNSPFDRGYLPVLSREDDRVRPHQGTHAFKRERGRHVALGVAGQMRGSAYNGLALHLLHRSLARIETFQGVDPVKAGRPQVLGGPDSQDDRGRRNVRHGLPLGVAQADCAGAFDALDVVQVQHGEVRVGRQLEGHHRSVLHGNVQGLGKVQGDRYTAPKHVDRIGKRYVRGQGVVVRHQHHLSIVAMYRRQGVPLCCADEGVCSLQHKGVVLSYGERTKVELPATSQHHVQESVRPFCYDVRGGLGRRHLRRGPQVQSVHPFVNCVGGVEKSLFLRHAQGHLRARRLLQRSRQGKERAVGLADHMADARGGNEAKKGEVGGF